MITPAKETITNLRVMITDGGCCHYPLINKEVETGALRRKRNLRFHANKFIFWLSKPVLPFVAKSVPTDWTGKVRGTG